MKQKLLLLLLIIFCSKINAQNSSLWTRINQDKTSSFDKKSTALSKSEELLFQLDEESLKISLNQINNKITNKKGIEMFFPNTNGELEKFLVIESSNFAPALQAKYPNIRAYSGTGITDKTASLYFSVSPKGIQSMVLRANSGSEFIEPTSTGKSVYKILNSKTRDTGNLTVACSTEDLALNKQLLNKTNKIKANDQIFKTFRLALSCNGEYSNYFGGTIAGALAAMNATMTRINGVLSNDLSVKFEIIANNDQIIYLDPLTDPYSDSSIGDASPDATWNIELQNNLTNVITNAGYDVGHLLSASGGGGNAGCIGCICVNPTPSIPRGKGSGWSAPSNFTPEGFAFDIDVVAHEMGHQLGGNHTFSYKVEGRGANIEPGSGSTIMGYAGVTSYNVQAHSDDYYSVNSILQIQNNLSSKTGAVNTVITNSPPNVNAGSNYTIPNGTAFILKGIGSDINGDTITYCWEENDSSLTQIDANSIAFPTKVDGPLFRSFYPNSLPIRYMPALKDVLSNTLTTKWESVSSVARDLNFTLTGRDNAGLGKAQTNTDAMAVTVSGTEGPFTLTSQNTTDLGWPQGSSQTITWTVNGTNTLQGSTNINIKLSTDGGLTFPLILASNTPNDGSETITVPAILATNCRLLIEPTANIYYAVNSKVFAVGYSVTSACNTYTFNAPSPIPDGLLTYTEKTVSVPTSSATIADVNVSLGITHTFMADVQIELVSPQGTTVKLFDQSCGNSSLKLNYDDLGSILNCGITSSQTVLPKQPLSAFNGQNPQNTWTLRFRDRNSGDVGTLDSASITICTQTFTLALPNQEIKDFVIYPNPNKGNFNIQFNSQSTGGVKIVVQDILGRKIFENNFENKSNFNQNIQLKNTQPGLYLLTVIDGDRKEVNKIIIE